MCSHVQKEIVFSNLEGGLTVQYNITPELVEAIANVPRSPTGTTIEVVYMLIGAWMISLQARVVYYCCSHALQSQSSSKS